MTKLAFLDTETTGLDPDQHEVWEVGLILRDGEGSDDEYHWMLPVDLGRADPMALKIGRYFDRAPHKVTTHPRVFADEFAALTHGAHLVGNVISFDEERLRRLLRRHGQCPMWHYHLVDVEAVLAGYLVRQPPWKSDELSEAIGITPPQGNDRHTALGDARWARDLYDEVMTSVAVTE